MGKAQLHGFLYARFYAKSILGTSRVKPCLAKSEAQLAEAKEKLAEVVAQVAELQRRYDESVGEKNRLRDEAEALELKLERADKLVGGLAGVIKI